MDPDLDRRFGGLRRLWGDAGAERCRRSHVVVVGIGGVGSWAAEALGRSGVGALTLIDLDHVAESNINRQVHASTHTVGQAKVAAMGERLASIHPGCRVVGVEEFLTPESADSLLARAERENGAVTAVLDACDQVPAKVALADWSVRQGVHHVVVGAAGGKTAAEMVAVADLAEVTHDPLLARLRQRLRKERGFPQAGRRMRVSAVFSREPVRLPVQCHAGAGEIVGGDGSLNCHGYGSLVTVTATFGLVAAGWLLNAIAHPHDTN